MRAWNGINSKARFIEEVIPNSLSEIDVVIQASSQHYQTLASTVLCKDWDLVSPSSSSTYNGAMIYINGASEFLFMDNQKKRAVMAHEMGHIYGINHVECGERALMVADINDPRATTTITAHDQYLLNTKMSSL